MKKIADAFKTLAILLLLTYFSSFSASADIVVDFTPYNCSSPSYDTTVQIQVNERLVIINRAPGPGSIQYIRELNGLMLDTVSGSYGDTLWNELVSNTDTLVSIRVLAMPGMCYGQRYHIQEPSGDSEITDPFHGIIIYGHTLIIDGADRATGMAIFDLSGKKVFSLEMQSHSYAGHELPRNMHGVFMLVLYMDGRTYDRKILLP
jgi:hypothetical protein